MTTRKDIVSAATDWIGTPYKHAGRNQYGIDCAGLIIKVANQTGVSNHDTKNYPKRPNAHDFIREMKEHLRRLKVRDARPGDIIMFRGPRIPCHVGILDFDDCIIHAYAPAKKVVREPFQGQIRGLAVMAFSYNGLED